MNRMWLPASFVVPERLVHERFVLRMLTVQDVVKDYDAVMSSIEHLEGVFGEGSDWPSPDLTLEQDLIDLGWHQKEFQRRSSFAYTVVTHDESQVLGCVYIYPAHADPAVEGGPAEAVVYFWVRQSAFDEGLEPVLATAVRAWIAEVWPFGKVHYPGRT